MPASPEVRRALGDQVIGWVEEHLDLELTSWQAEYLRNLYGITATPEV